MEIKSPDFENNTLIPSRYTGDGEDVNPEIEISGVPEGTKSLALIMDDPDSPSGTWTHWLLWNISPGTEHIPAGSIPAASVEGLNMFGKKGYGGPFPHEGTHRYFFKLYALDTLLELEAFSDKEALEKVMQEHILDQADLVGLYTRTEGAED